MSSRDIPEQGAASPSVISLAGDAVRNQDGHPVLMGSRCTECGALSFPRVAVCVECMSESFVDEPMPEQGKLYSWTTVHVGPRHMHKPITLGYVDLDNGVRFPISRATDLAFDQKMKITVAEVGREANNRPRLRHSCSCRKDRSRRFGTRRGDDPFGKYPSVSIVDLAWPP